MKTIVDGKLLDRLAALPLPPTAAQALDAIEWLGGLAPWWLKLEVLQIAAERCEAMRGYLAPPPLPGSLGSCWIALAMERPIPVLRQAVLLPLCWQKGCEDAVELPPALRARARMVVEQLRAPDWGLHLHDKAGPVDLRALAEEMTVDSGWASLAGGLILAMQERLPVGDVWASAAWHDRFGIGPVNGLPAKLALAREWRVKRLFVPGENQRQALEANDPRSTMKIEALMPVPEKPVATELLRPYLAHLGAEPDENAPFDKRKQHYSSIGRRDADDYYWRCLLADVVKRCAGELRRGPEHWKPSHIVTVASLSPAVVTMGPLAIGAKHCLLLHEADAEGNPAAVIVKTVDLVCTRLAGKMQVTLGPLRLGDREEELRQIKDQLCSFCAGVRVDQVVYDLTPAYRSIVLALLALAVPKSWLLYCRHQQMEPDNRPEPGTERYDRWQR